MNATSKNAGRNPEAYKDWEEIKQSKNPVQKIMQEKSQTELGDVNEQERIKESLDSLMPDWAKGNTQAEEIWQDFVTEFLAAKLAGRETQASALAEYFEHYYRIILGELTELFLPNEVWSHHHGFGAGFWEGQYYAGAGPNPTEAAQYLSPRNILEADHVGSVQQRGYYRAIRSTHFNLCGQLAVIEALGISLPEGLRIFYEDVDRKDHWGNTILGNTNRGTYAAELIDHILAIGKREGRHWNLSHHYLASTEERITSLLEILKNSDIVIALVNIDPSKSGKGRVGMNGSTAHWVVLQHLFEMAGERFLRIYNPFMNREEVYLWEVFDQGWEKAELNSAPRFIRGKKIA